MRDVPLKLLTRLKDKYQTPANNSNPALNVILSRAKTTVSDSEYWTVETIRSGPGLSTVSVAPVRDDIKGVPDRIYSFAIVSGQAVLSVRAYPDHLKDGWQDIYTAGAGVSTAIAIDGRWERFGEKWRQRTDELPWIFWVDTQNVLWRQYWTDESTRTTLATGVLQVSAIRAWKSVSIPQKDQGIVVSYIKQDQKLYYRNFCQQENLSFAWENERQVLSVTSNANAVNLFLTNDYRLGFAVSLTTGQMQWVVTKRNWSGMALENEHLNLRATCSLEFTPVRYTYPVFDESLLVSPGFFTELLFASTHNEIIVLENIPVFRTDEFGAEYEDWGFAIAIRLKNPSVAVPDFNVIDTNTGAAIAISDIEQVVNGLEYILHIDDVVLEYGINNVLSDINVIVSGYENPAGLAYETQEKTFIPKNLIPVNIPLPEVEELWNE